MILLLQLHSPPMLRRHLRLREHLSPPRSSLPPELESSPVPPVPEALLGPRPTSLAHSPYNKKELGPARSTLPHFTL